MIGRIQKSDASNTTLEALQSTVFELCCEYPYRDARDLRDEAHRWLRRISELLRNKAVGLRAHEELLTSTGWLALLVGCLEYDMGLRTAAEVTRTAAQSLGEEADNAEIIGWTHEMSAWFALTQGRYGDVVSVASSTQHTCRNHSVVVQLVAQEAKALARMHNGRDLPKALERGHQLLSRFPIPERTDHHFVVDPAKWDFYAMDAYRLAGDDVRASMHAHEVIVSGTAPDGTERAPMRMAEARLTLAVCAAKRGDLEGAIELGRAALSPDRKSLPS